jgi:hypothetical protein
VVLARLRQDCVLAKETLSLDTETVVPVFLPGRCVEIRLDRTTFEQMLRSPLESTLVALSRAVESAGLTSADVDAVLLVGGSSRIPLVAETVAREFGRPLVEGVHPVHAAALGAAALAGVPAPAAHAVPVVLRAAASGTAAPITADRHGGGSTQIVDLPRFPTAGLEPRHGDVSEGPSPAAASVALLRRRDIAVALTAVGAVAVLVLVFVFVLAS